MQHSRLTPVLLQIPPGSHLQSLGSQRAQTPGSGRSPTGSSSWPRIRGTPVTPATGGTSFTTPSCTRLWRATVWDAGELIERFGAISEW